MPVGGEGDGGGGQDEEGDDVARLFYVQTSAAGVVLEYPGTRKQPLCGTLLSPESQVVDVDVSMRKDGRRWTQLLGDNFTWNKQGSQNLGREYQTNSTTPYFRRQIKALV